jgi:hypothetical protein
MPVKRRASRITLSGPKNAKIGKDLRISGCGICGKYIFSNQKYTWTHQMGYVHDEDCLERVT